MKAPHAAVILCAVALLGFGIYHWIFVAPVAAVFVEGLIWVIAGGWLLGRAYERAMLEPGRRGPAWGLVFGAAMASTLLPAELAGLIWGPFPEIAGPGDILTALPLAFVGLPVAILMGLLLGATGRFVAASTVLHFMIAGSLAHFGGRGVTAVLFFGFFAYELLAGVALALLTENAHVPAEASSPTA